MSLRKFLQINALLLLCMFSAQLSAQDKGVIRIGGLPDMGTAPYIWVDNCAQSFAGTLPHLANKVLGELGYSVTYQAPLAVTTDSWEKAFDELRDGSHDVAISITKPAPKGIAIGSEPMIYQIISFVKRRPDTLSYSNLKSLVGKKGVVLDASEFGSGYPLLKKLESQGLDVSNAPMGPEAVNLLDKGLVDYVIGDHYYLLGNAKAMNISQRLQFIKLENGKGIYLGVKRDGPYANLPKLADPYFRELRETGMIERFSQDYLLKWMREDC